jgi:hypothetical protein
LNARPARVIAALAALGCAAVGALLAWHYPVAPAAAVASFVMWGAISYRWPFAWLFVIPALLPISGFATWTGWFAFEELDLLVLGAASGGYARLAFAPGAGSPGERASSAWPSLAATILTGLFAASCAISLYRGIADAGGLSFDWIGSYDSAMNSLRLCKTFASALLLWPLLQLAFRRDQDRAVHSLAAGIAVGLGGVCLAALWERAAFADVLDFSSDYRTTALFWEMHVGGAALDGFLALTVPFAVWELRGKPGPLRFGLALALVALAAYACLTTFSRGVYLAIPIGLAVLGLLTMLQRGSSLGAMRMASGGKAVLLIVLAGAALFLVFRGGGYRAMLVFCTTLAVALHVASASRSVGFARMTLAWCIGLSLGLLDALLASAVPKGPYVLFGIAFACNVALSRWHADSPAQWHGAARWTLLIWLAAAAAVVALHWGGNGAFWDSVVALLAMLGLAMRDSNAKMPWAPADLRLRLTWLSMLVLIAGSVAVFFGGAYMGGRFATSSEDLDVRTHHWSEGIGMLHGTADWVLGKGFGRFPASYFFGVPGGDIPGSFSLHYGGERQFLSLAGPANPTDWGNLFRIAQRVASTPGLYTALLEVRAERRIDLHVEICEQNLLYNGACTAGSVAVPEAPGWQRVSVVLDGRGLSGGPWWAPRLAFFSMSVANNGQSVDVDDVALIGPDGSNILRNGSFLNGMARWIPISEKFHLPWHIKNLALNLLFDQGIFGLTLFVFLLIASLWRLTFGAARRPPVAPALAAALVGFIVVGAFDSLLDVPRVAFLFYTLLLAAFSLSSPKAAAVAAT